MFCPNCGKEISDLAAVCVGCGRNLEGVHPKNEKRASAGWWWLGFLIPMAGILIWIFCHDNEPKKAKKAGVGALFGIGISIALVILFYVFWFFLIFRLASSGSYYL